MEKEEEEEAEEEEGREGDYLLKKKRTTVRSRISWKLVFASCVIRRSIARTYGL